MHTNCMSLCLTSKTVSSEKKHFIKPAFYYLYQEIQLDFLIHGKSWEENGVIQTVELHLKLKNLETDGIQQQVSERCV